jgi:hypothetical protein
MAGEQLAALLHVGIDALSITAEVEREALYRLTHSPLGPVDVDYSALDPALLAPFIEAVVRASGPNDTEFQKRLRSHGRAQLPRNEARRSGFVVKGAESVDPTLMTGLASNCRMSNEDTRYLLVGNTHPEVSSTLSAVRYSGDGKRSEAIT